MIPGIDDLWFLPLGGCGEIGMNMNLYGHSGRWLMVDCGVTFGKRGAPGPHVQMPDPAFIVENRQALTALLITHAHEDHIGAVTHLWPSLRCPVYATPFAAEILRRKLAEAGLLRQVPVRIVMPGDTLSLDGFDVEWISLTHSTPESQALVIRTAAGSIFHTGDWKLDDDPVVGPVSPVDRLKALADEDVVAMVCDSTNALVEGHSLSEGELAGPLDDLIARAPGRVVVGCFGSNVARLHTLAQLAGRNGRYAGLLGRSLRNYHSAALAADVWDPRLRLIDPSHLGYLPREEVLAIATGSQGEAGAALDRLAADSHPDLSLEAGDCVLMSSRVIPGNEIPVAALRERLGSLAVEVIADSDLNLPIHASGHPARAELRDLYTWVRPQVAIPVHGENAHMLANAQLADEVGVPRQMHGENGDLFMLAPQVGVRRGVTPVGRLGVDDHGRITRMTQW